MSVIKINMKAALSAVSENLKLQKLGEINNHCIQLVKLQGEYEMHKHEKEDKLFMVMEGTLFLELSIKEIVEITEGESVIVPKGVEQKPFSPKGVSLVIIEPERN